MDKDTGDILVHSNAPEVRGHKAYNELAPLWIRIISFLVDLGWICVVFYMGVRIFNQSPIPGTALLLSYTVTVLVLWLLQQIFFGASLGQLAWRLTLLDHKKRKLQWPGAAQYLFRGKVRSHQTERMSLEGLLTASLLTALSLGLSAWTVTKIWIDHPMMRTTEDIEIAAFAPSADQVGEKGDWLIAPFFYALGAWPKTFAGHPILYSLPYKKGPPTHFIGNIVARWSMPDIRLTIEGPRTPTHGESAAAIRDCLHSRAAELFCLSLRKNSLARHIDEMRALNPTRWELKWFYVNNTGIPPEEVPQGIFLSAANDLRAQERYILINSSGAHQTLILSHSVGQQGDLAKSYLERSLGSLRISNKLETGRIWSDKMLSDIHLKELDTITDQNRLVSRLAEIQALLISKISVEPSNFDAYFHLGGTSLMLARLGATQSIHQDQDEVSTVAKPMLQNILRYAQDVAPNNPRTAQIENFWRDSKKY